MKINTLNTLSQNNPAFGVRIPIKEATISKLKDQIAEKPQLPADGSILGRIYYKIMNTKQENSSLISFFHAIASSNKKLKKLLEKSGKTLECAFWETCDKFFDVQLVANDKDKNVDNISDAKIKEDSYLIRIFHPIKNIEEKRKQIIEYCIKNYSEAKDNRDEFCEKIKDELNLDMQANSIQISILGPILRLPEYYNDFKNAIQKEEPTFTEFKEYLKKKAFYDNNKFYNSGNGELLEYTIETFKKYVPEFKEEFVFAEDTIANANTIGKERKKRTTPEQIYDDAVAFINYYIGDNIINSKQTSKEIYSALFDTNIESNPNEDHVSLGTLQHWTLIINKIKETLEEYPNKTDEEIKNDIKNEYHSMNCILGKKEIFSRAINKLRALNKTTNDNIVETSDTDSDYVDNHSVKINSDTLQTKINTRASIKGMHELDSSESKAMNNTEKNNDVPLQADEFRNDNIIELVSTDNEETTNDNTVEKNDDTTQTNTNPRASIKRTHEPDSSEPKVMDNFTNCFDTLIKVAQLNSPKDNTKQNNDTTQTNINTRANIKRTHVTKPLDIDKTCFNSLLNADKILKENESEVFNTKDTLNKINMFEAKRQHVIPNQGAPILPNLNNKTVIPMPKAINNNEKNDITVNEKRPHLFKQSPLEDNNEVDNNFSIYDGRSFFTKFAFS